MNVTAADNGTSITNPAITFTSSNPEIVSVDNSGKVMGISLGQAVITAELKYHNAISDTITITSADITASTGTSITVQADISNICTGKYVVLKAALSDGATVFAEHILEIIDI